MCSIAIEHISALDMVKHLEDNYDVMPYTVNFRQEYSLKLAQNAEFCVARGDENKIIGVVAFYCNQPPIAYISHACIDSSHRGKKLIEKMLNTVQQFVVSKNFDSLRVEVLNDNYPAIKAYENFGFSFISKASPKSLMHKSL